MKNKFHGFKGYMFIFKNIRLGLDLRLIFYDMTNIAIKFYITIFFNFICPGNTQTFSKSWF